MMDLQVHGEDLNVRELWLDGEELIDMNHDSFFYGDDFPSIDIACMSSSVSSSANSSVAVKNLVNVSGSASSPFSSVASSTAVMKSEEEELDADKMNHNYYDGQRDPLDVAAAIALSSTAGICQAVDQVTDGGDCLNVMENFGYMDLLENNDFLDPCSVFQPGENFPHEFHNEQQRKAGYQMGNEQQVWVRSEGEEMRKEGRTTDDLSMMFLEWLKKNKETVSVEDLRRVRIRKSTIESAAKRLGGGKEAMKYLLKLILKWVEANQLQRRRIKESSSHIDLHDHHLQDQSFRYFSLNPNFKHGSSLIHEGSNPCVTQNSWTSSPSYMSEPETMVGCGSCNSYMNCQQDCLILEANQSTHASPFPLFEESEMNFSQPYKPVFSAAYGTNQGSYQYLGGQGDGSLGSLASSATKEARKKRMARQRRLLSHHHRNQTSQSSCQHNQQQDQFFMGHHERSGIENDTPVDLNKCNKIWDDYWNKCTPVGADAWHERQDEDAPADHRVDRSNNMQVCGCQRQEWKPEKNLRFLLQKVLKQSDVGNLGRIVLPKKEAETHLPELEARDGISISMEDIGTSRVWNMRYRFWPNNKSRMYLLENTGDFVRTNGLQEGDSIVIYSDMMCSKYLIRGVKVGQTGPKQETKKAGKMPRIMHGNSAPILAADY